MAEIKVYSMTDVGKRIDFLMELHSLWCTGLDIVTTGRMSTLDKLQAEELKSALRLLTYHMQNDFNFNPYEREINNLPNAKNLDEIGYT